MASLPLPPSPQKLQDLHHAMDDIPCLPLDSDLEICTICLQAKLKKAAHGTTSTYAPPTVFGQGLGIDIGFMFQNSKNEEWVKLLEGANGKNTYFFIVNFYSGYLFGIPTNGKAPRTYLVEPPSHAYSIPQS